jgi:gamma-glutamyl hydrolase
MATARHRTYKKNRSYSVGILTIPHSRKMKYGSSHIMKSYVDWFEQRGVHVIPIPYDTDHHQEFFQMINGLFIPGGETQFIMKNDVFIDTVSKFFELSLEKNEYFPIWGTCFGFEVLMAVVGGFTKFKKYNGHGLTPIQITSEGRKSRLFGSFSKKYLNYLENEKSTLENHEFGISPSDFMDHLHLKRFFNILATSIDEDGKEYVAAIEGKYYPIYGVQWHPERQSSGKPFVDFFISEIKKNKHRFKSHFPSLRSFMTPHKCLQYNEHKQLLCYFF